MQNRVFELFEKCGKSDKICPDLVAEEELCFFLSVIEQNIHLIFSFLENVAGTQQVTVVFTNTASILIYPALFLSV